MKPFRCLLLVFSLISLIGALALLPVAGSASVTVAPSLTAVTEGIESLYRSITTLRMTFVQETSLELLGRAVRKSGEMGFKRPGKFFIHYTTPPLKEYISNGEKLWVVLPDEAAVYQTAVKKGEIDEQARIFLDGLGNLKQSFLVSVLTDEQRSAARFQAGDSQVHLQLIPMADSPFFIWIALAVDPKTYMVQEMTLFNQSQNVSHYVFSATTVNPALDEDKFVLTPQQAALVKKN